jgi:hypothetical protein
MLRGAMAVQAPQQSAIMEQEIKGLQDTETARVKAEAELAKEQRDLQGKLMIEQMKAQVAEGKQLTPVEMSKLATTYRKEFESLPHIRDANEVFSAVARMDKAFDAYKKNPKAFESKNALDQALIIVYNKMLDPGSVVRESEYARTPQGISVINRMQGFGEKIAKGGSGLTDKDREDIVNMAKILEDATGEIYDNTAEIYKNEANLLNIDPNRIIKQRAKKDNIVKTSDGGEYKIISVEV